jgi:hypothetical protein
VRVAFAGRFGTATRGIRNYPECYGLGAQLRGFAKNSGLCQEFPGHFLHPPVSAQALVAKSLVTSSSAAARGFAKNPAFQRTPPPRISPG